MAFPGSKAGSDFPEQVDYLLPPDGGGVELATHLGEPSVDVVAEVNEILSEFDEIVARGVETRRHGLTEVAELAAELGNPRFEIARLHKS